MQGMRLARGLHSIQTALLEARLLWGSPPPRVVLLVRRLRGPNAAPAH